jgi:hypothetical protein
MQRLESDKRDTAGERENPPRRNLGLVCRMHREVALLVASFGGVFPDAVTVQRIAELTGLEASSLTRYRKDWPRPLSGSGRQARVWRYDQTMRDVLRRQFPHVDFPDSLA